MMQSWGCVKYADHDVALFCFAAVHRCHRACFSFQQSVSVN